MDASMERRDGRSLPRDTSLRDDQLRHPHPEQRSQQHPPPSQHQHHLQDQHAEQQYQDRRHQHQYEHHHHEDQSKQPQQEQPHQQHGRRSRNHYDYRRERSDMHDRSFRRGPPSDYWLPPHVSALEYNSLPYGHMGPGVQGPMGSMYPYPYYPRPSSRSGSVVTTDTSFNQELPSRSSLEAFSKHWNFYLRNPHLFERLRLENPSHYNSLNNYYKMCGQLLNLPPIRIPKSLQMLARGEHRRHQEDLDSTDNRSERRDSVATTSNEPPAIMAPLKFSTAHTKAIFANTMGSIAQLEAKNPTQGQKSVITFYEIGLKMVDREDGKLANFPGPLVPGQTHKGDVIQFCQSRIRACKELKIDSTSPRNFDRDSYILMYELLILFLRQNNAFDGTDIAELLVSNNNHVIPIKDEESTSNPSLTSNTMVEEKIPVSKMSQQQVTDKFRELLLHGLKKEALDFAMQQDLWGHALFLASKMDNHSYAKVLLSFANGLPANDPLQTLYQLMSGRQPMAVKNSASAVEWRSHLAMMLANPTSHGNVDFKAIVTMGDNLREKGLIYAAHFCYLMSGLPFERFSDGDVRMALIGSDVNNEEEKRFEAFATSEAIQCTEIFEYAQRLANPHFFLPHFQYYKMIYALRLLDNGMPKIALCYVEQVAKMVDVQRGLLPSPDDSLSNAGPTVFLEQLLEVALRLKYLDPSYTTGEGEYNEMADPHWISELQENIKALRSQLENEEGQNHQQPVEQAHEHHKQTYDEHEYHHHEVPQKEEVDQERASHRNHEHLAQPLEPTTTRQVVEHGVPNQEMYKEERKPSELGGRQPEDDTHNLQTLDDQVDSQTYHGFYQQQEQQEQHQHQHQHQHQDQQEHQRQHFTNQPQVQQPPVAEEHQYQFQRQDQQHPGYMLPDYYDEQVASSQAEEQQSTLVNGVTEGFVGVEPIMMKPIPEVPSEQQPPSIPMVSSATYVTQQPMVPTSPMMTSTPIEHMSPAQPIDTKEETQEDKKGNKLQTDQKENNERKINDKKSKKEDSKDQPKQAKSQGLFGRLLGAFVKPGPNQMILPEDKTQSIVWDEEKKRWVDTTAGDDDDNGQSAAPPSDVELSRNNSMANMQQLNNNNNNNNNTSPMGNKFAGNLAKRKAMLGRVDVFKHSQSTPVLAGTMNQDGQPPLMAPQPTLMAPQPLGMPLQPSPMPPQSTNPAPQPSVAPPQPTMMPSMMTPMHDGPNMMTPVHNTEPPGAVATQDAAAGGPQGESVMMFFNPNQFAKATTNNGQPRSVL